MAAVKPVKAPTSTNTADTNKGLNMRRTGELMSRSVTVAKKLNPIIPNSGPPMAAPASEAHSIDFPETWWVRVLPPVVVVVVVGCCLLVLLLVISHCSWPCVFVVCFISFCLLWR